MRKVKYTKDFAIKKKGDEQILGDMLASQLVHVHKVAKYVTEAKKPTPKQKPKKK